MDCGRDAYTHLRINERIDELQYSVDYLMDIEKQRALPVEKPLSEIIDDYHKIREALNRVIYAPNDDMDAANHCDRLIIKQQADDIIIYCQQIKKLADDVERLRIGINQLTDQNNRLCDRNVELEKTVNSHKQAHKEAVEYLKKEYAELFGARL